MINTENSYCANILLICNNLVEIQKVQNRLLDFSLLEYRLNTINSFEGALKHIQDIHNIDIIILDKRLMKNICNKATIDALVNISSKIPIIYITSDEHFEKLKLSNKNVFNQYPIICRKNLWEINLIIRNLLFPSRVMNSKNHYSASIGKS
jgi:hypothetical protein